MQGTFDDCQALVKRAFADDDLRRHVWLTPANSINLGRLLPQVFYYFVLAGSPACDVVSVPSGNFGNLTAGLIAKRIGLPIRHFVAATNVNDSVPVYLRPATTSRGRPLTDGGQRDGRRRAQQLRTRPGVVRLGPRTRSASDVEGFAYGDARVVAEIASVHRRHGYVLDPHSAIAWLALQDALTQDPDAHGVFLATAHPAKFREIVEPAIGRPVPLPPELCRGA